MSEDPIDDGALSSALRRALHEEADMIEPQGDGLSRIQRRTSRSPWWRPAVAAVGAAAVLGAGVGIGLVLDDRGGGDASTSTPPAASAPSTPAPSTPPGTAAAMTAPPAIPQVAVPLYWVGTEGGAAGSAAGSAGAGQGSRLYREFRRVFVPPGADVDVAVRQVLLGRPTDPDYRSAWPGGTSLRSVQRSGSVVTLDLAGPRSAAAANATMAVQQLVHTVTAADPTVTAVRLTLDGATLSSAWGRGWPGSSPVVRAPQTDVLAFVWLSTPEEGASLPSPVTLTGQATVFEATVSWEVLDATGTNVVTKGFTTASAGAPARGTWKAVVTLPPGRYVLRAFESSAADGSMRWPDTKTITVTR